MGRRYAGRRCPVGKRVTGSLSFVLSFVLPLLGLAVVAGWKWAVRSGVAG